MFHRKNQGINLLLALLLILGSAGFFLKVAATRPFWTDESFSFVETLMFPIWTMLREGASGQCSPPPLYYLVLKIWLVLPHSLDPLIYYRIPSALAAGLFLAALVWRWRIVGLAVAALFFHDPLLLNHATEARPYALWLCLSYFLFVFIRRYLQSNHWKDLLGIGFLALTLAFVSIGSIFQILGLVVWLVLCERELLKKIGPALVPAFIVLIYYIFIPVIDCQNFPGKDGIHSLTGTLPHGNFSLVKSVLRLVVSRELVELPFELAALVGIALLWKKKHKLDLISQREIWAILVSFGFAMVGTAAAVAYKNYYFVPRLFIFMLAGRAIVLASLISIAKAYFEQKAANQYWYTRAINIFLLMISLGIIIQTIRTYHPS